MSVGQRLSASLGKSISQICDGKFHDLSQNHCAHFVSHLLDLGFSFNCREFMGGNGHPANVRVHEVFAQCPKVGRWADADRSQTQIVFVTKEANVNIATKTMINIPQKHVGIWHDGKIWHYANTADKVVAWTDDEFLTRFQGIYDGHQALFFGTIPGSDLELNIQPRAESVPRGLAFDLRKTGKQWFAKANRPGESEFYVGREVTQGDYIGLMMKTSEYYGPSYSAADHDGRLDHWANLLELSGHCESKNRFNLINTYDNAKFTFGFYQLAAHTPNDNLILLFRRMLALPAAADYFPELKIVNGHLTRVDEDGGQTDLEIVTPTGPNGRRQPQNFMDFLNAKRLEHDRQEVLQSARMIHWSNRDPALNALQVDLASEILQRKMTTYAGWYGLDHKSDVLCALVADIHHQGRAKRVKVAAALGSANPERALIDINPSYAQRAADLREKLAELRAAGRIGTKTYRAATNEFV
jgi:hypothetical protein